MLTINRLIVIKFIRDHAGLDDFLIHGIRHLVSTKLKELKVHPYIARQLMDHAAFNDVHAGYEHSDDRDDMLAALEKWCAHIEKLLQYEIEHAKPKSLKRKAIPATNLSASVH